MKTRTFNDWTPETKSLIEDLIAAGFTITSGDNGEARFKFTGDMPAFIAELTACDESRLYVKSSTGKKLWLYLVFGNSPGELPSDHTSQTDLDAVCATHYDKWEGKKQPTKEEKQ